MLVDFFSSQIVGGDDKVVGQNSEIARSGEGLGKGLAVD